MEIKKNLEFFSVNLKGSFLGKKNPKDNKTKYFEKKNSFYLYRKSKKKKIPKKMLLKKCQTKREVLHKLQFTNIKKIPKEKISLIKMIFKTMSNKNKLA